MVKRLAAICSAVGLAAAHATDISIPSNLTTRKLVKDVYGYSIEPVWLDDYLTSDLAANLLSTIADVTSKPPPIRVGGNTADKTYLHSLADQGFISAALPNSSSVQSFNITPEWFDTWANYFPEGTNIIYTINLAYNASAFSNAVAQAEAAYNAFGENLELIELGNEIDHFVASGFRAPGWDVAEYIPQWRNLTSQIIASDWYQNAESPPKFQAAAFADPPWVPDQQVDHDDFDIINLTAAGLVDPDIIETYAVHLYPMSTCDTGRWYRMRLDLLSNHSVLWQNVSQYVPQVAAADAAGSPLVLGETNSVSCGGRSGISDTFGAALWGVDYVLMAASIGIEKVYFHLGARSQYAAFTPLPYELLGESLTSGIRANFYGHYFVAQVVKDCDACSIAALPGANSSDLSGYGVYSGDDLQKLVFLDMGVWNSSEGLHNPSTLTATDSTFVSEGTRPTSNMKITTPWEEGSTVSVIKLSSPGTNAKSITAVNVAGVTFDPATGTTIGDLAPSSLTVGAGGVVEFEIVQAEAVLLELDEATSASD